jgi:transposase
VPDITPRAAVGDKGYDSKGNRVAARERGICPVIPFKSSAQNRPAFFPKALYRARARIEQLVGKLKRFKRIALRCEKTNKNFGSFVAFALGLIHSLLASSSPNPSTRPRAYSSLNRL